MTACIWVRVYQTVDICRAQFSTYLQIPQWDSGIFQGRWLHWKQIENSNTVKTIQYVLKTIKIGADICAVPKAGAVVTGETIGIIVYLTLPTPRVYEDERPGV